MTRKSKIEDNSTQIRDTALNLLARREHSVWELRHKLLRRGFELATVVTLIEELITQDLLNESRYAKIYTCHRIDKGYGPLRIRKELLERGIAKDIVASTLEPYETLWMSKLVELHRKRFNVLAPENSFERIQQLRFLRHRGFTLEQIQRLFRQS